MIGKVGGTVHPDDVIDFMGAADAHRAAAVRDDWTDGTLTVLYSRRGE